LESARNYAEGLPGKSIFVGNDKLLGPGLAVGAAGCITAGANLWSQRLRNIFEANSRGEDTSLMQKEVDAMRALMDAIPPAAAYAKAMLHKQHQLPFWSVKPPLRDFVEQQMQSALSAVESLKQSA
jgi:dihydrodipicolinate synthase/N-acetylneuraminate lyase